MREPVSVPDSRVAVSAGSHRAILWIDDHPDEAGLLRFLSLEGFRVATATTGTAGLALAGAHRYDAIVVDLHLPDLHGFSVIERLRANGISCPVVAVTGYYLDPETSQHAHEAGAAAFQYKPLWAEETAEWLRTIVGPHTSGGTAVRPSPSESGARPGGEPPPANANAGEMVIVRLLARLDRLVSTALPDSEQRSRDAQLGALLSALADPALPLTGVRGCAQALHMTLSSHAGEEELTTNARDLVRQATRRSLAARHPITRKALAILLGKPRWWEEVDLAHEVAASRSHLARVVHQDTGLEYRTLRRLVVMKAGMVDVLTTDEQVAQIAYRLGMQPGKFDDVFRETFGGCPRELRRLWSRLLA
jgi:CheY-like chemotaxis protein